MKKAQLATPTGIDRDYNYLKGIERIVHDAGQNVSQRGIGVEPPKSKIALRAWQHDSSFQKYLVENHITVQHAPKGMSRQKNNHTRAAKSGNVLWTVEWVTGSGNRSIQHDCVASHSVAELYCGLQVQTRNAEKRRLNLEKSESGKRGSKRKRTHPGLTDLVTHEDGPGHQVPRTRHVGTEELPRLDNVYASGKYEGVVPDRGNEEATHADADVKIEQDDDSDSDTSPVQFILHNPHGEDSPNPPLKRNATGRDKTPRARLKSDPADYYYLLKPGTPGKTHVLIPLDANTSLTTTLRDRVVQEYPTIYVLREPPDNLPAGFSLEERYVKTEDAQRDDMGSTTREGMRGLASTRQAANTVQVVQELDRSSILDMLRRNVAG